MATADRETTDREPESQRGPASPALPNARLNPLLNPLLAKQLGRWAHIYYTASIDKREAAIEKLVCELEAEEARLSGEVHMPAPLETSAESFSASKSPGPMLVASQPVAAPTNLADADPHPQETLGESSGFAHLPETVSPSANSAALEEKIEALPGSWQELLRRNAVEPASPEHPAVTEIRDAEHDSVHATIPEPDRSAAEDYRSFGDLLAKSDAAIEEATFTARPKPRSWKVALATVAALAFLAGSLWVAKSGFRQKQAAQTPQSHPNAAELRPAQPSPVTSTITVNPPAPSKPTSAPVAVSVKPPLTDAADKPGFHEVLVSKNGTQPETGQPADPELATGMRYLQGKDVPRDSAEAARHLWLSVKKENGAALVVLAGLYAQGDGVAKDCDQAKILLDAAARQAKSHTLTQRVEIGRESLRTSGCE